MRSFRTDHLLRVLVATAFIWGLVVPIVHLACGMAEAEAAELCSAHGEMPDDAESSTESNHAHMAIACPMVDAGSKGTMVECCWVETDVADRVAPLPNLSQVLELHLPTADVQVPSGPVQAPSVDAVMKRGSPPIALRLLFSVFLI